MLAAILAGIVAGAVHVFAGPDHLVAVTPLAVSERRRAWRAGVRWGLGHTAGVAVIAALAFFLRELLPLEWLSGWSERLVGVVLIAIGLWAVRTALRTRVHTHQHDHDGARHSHVHVHSEGCGPDSDHAHAHPHTAFGVGALHGLAGSSHVLGVLPALALPSESAAVGYLAGYGLASVIAMGGFALGVGLLSERLGKRTGSAYRRFLSVAGSTAIALGLFWIVR